MKSDNYPEVSIIIITYNAGHEIDQCLSSVFKVNYPKDKFEVIIVDSGSTDETLEIVKKYPVAKVIVKKPSLRGEARDIGLREATGEIVAMVDSDLTATDNDWLVRAIKPFTDPNVALVRGRDVIIYPGKGINFFQKAIYFLSIPSRRILLKKEDLNGK